MPLSPLEIQKMTFRSALRGYDPNEVKEFLHQVAEDMTAQNQRIHNLEARAAELHERLEQSAEREQELQRIVVQAQQVSDSITANAKREAELAVREAEVTAEKIISQALEQATQIEARINELRTRRQELQLKFKNSLELFSRLLEADIEEERSTARIHTLPRSQREVGE